MPGEPKTRRIVVNRLGGPEVLSVEEVTVPPPGPGEVAVDVAAAGVAYADVLMRQGRYPGGPNPPFTPGYDLVGTVAACGPGVGGLRDGQRVVAMPRFGAYAATCVLPSDEFVAAPSGPGDAETVSVVLNYTTAYQLLHRAARIEAGQSVLVYSAAGGVGTAVLHLAALAGVRVIGLASARKHDLVRRLGGEPLEYRGVDVVEAVRGLAPDGVDAVLNPAGGRSLLDSAALLRPGGRLAVFGNFSGEPAPQGLQATPIRYSVATWKADHPDEWRADLAHLLDLLAAGRIAPVIADVLPLDRAAEAHRRLEAGEVEGKLVLRPGL